MSNPLKLYQISSLSFSLICFKDNKRKLKNVTYNQVSNFYNYVIDGWKANIRLHGRFSVEPTIILIFKCTLFLLDLCYTYDVFNDYFTLT